MGNALGSHAGEQELAGVYISLPFLPPHLVCKMTNILVAAIFYKKHRKIFGNEAVFSKVITQLKEICLNGIVINIGGIAKTV